MHSRFRLCLAAFLAAAALGASEHRGQVTFRGSPVPGAVITAARDGAKSLAVTNPQGIYSFADLTDGIWGIEVSMFGFAPARQDILVSPGAPAAKWELTMLPLDQIRAQARPSEAPARPAAGNPERATPQTADDGLSERAADGFLINGSVNNAAAASFAQAAAFGNNRAGGRNLYNGGIGVILGNSALDARPFSLTGQNMPKAAYSRTTGVLSLGGPLRIPRLLPNGPIFFFGYQWTRNNNATTASALLPGLPERNGVFAIPVRDPLTGAPFPGNVIPAGRISPQARALLVFYPPANLDRSTGYNYQVPLLNPTHQDALQTRLAKMLGPNNQVFGHFDLQSTRTGNPNLFGFLDTTGIAGVNTAANWSHRFNPRWFLNLGCQFSRLSTRVTPYFENRENVSARAGISGNSQASRDWGPPALVFSSGIAGLADAQSSFNRNQTSGLSYSVLWNRRAHNFTFGGDFRRQEFNYLSQQDARGTFTFTGAATGSDFADFLLGIPNASSIAYGNADKYFRQSVYDAFASDDWRIHQSVTLNAGARWEYGAPITELYGRLVNLDIAPGFAAAAPVLAGHPAGALTSRQYPGSLVWPDKSSFAPRVGVAWRPVAASSLIVRAGYGIYYDTSVYQAIALRMAQQAPLSKTFSAQNSALNPLTLANGFSGPAGLAGNTFAVDPDFRPGYAQNWQLSIQRDLPGSLQMTATYLGIKGTRAMQAFLPNTFPAGTADSCSTCPRGFAYLVSNGNSSRQAVQIQLRRRLRAGFGAALQYTFSKSIDNAGALGGPGAAGAATSPATGLGGIAIAQNWTDPRAERSLSPFDQRHLLSLHAQYTSGMGLAGGTLLSGWKGALSKGWTISTQITAGSGRPQTPLYLAPVEGTGFTGTLRPDYTGAPLSAAPPGHFLNPSAFSPPLAGRWGNAGRNSITGPAQFLLNASVGRTFRLTDRFNLDLRVDSINALNHVSFTAWNTTVNSTQFGLPAAANAMRSVQTTLRVRF